jgi:hypothetical protein
LVLLETIFQTVVDFFVKLWAKVIDVIIFYTEATFYVFAPLSLKAVVGRYIYLVFGTHQQLRIVILHLLALGDFIDFQVNIAISENAITMSEPFFELAIKDTGAAICTSLEDLTTSAIWLIKLPLTLVRHLTFLNSVKIITNLAMTMLLVVKIVATVDAPIDHALLSVAMLAPMAVVALVVYFIKLGETATAMILVVQGVEVAHVVRVIHEL